MACLSAGYWRATSAGRSWLACWAGPVRPAFPLCGPLEDLEVSLHVVFRSQLREAAGRGGGRRSADGVLSKPQHSLAEQGEALGGLPLVLLGSQRRGSVRVLHGGVVVVGTLKLPAFSTICGNRLGE